MITSFNIYNECLSCDGLTKSHVRMCEEKTLDAIFKYHLTNKERKINKLNYFSDKESSGGTIS